MGQWRPHFERRAKVAGMELLAGPCKSRRSSGDQARSEGHAAPDVEDAPLISGPSRTPHDNVRRVWSHATGHARACGSAARVDGSIAFIHAIASAGGEPTNPSDAVAIACWSRLAPRR